MLTPDRRQRIFSLALPIIGGMVSQNVLNLVDTAMVGVLGVAALGRKDPNDAMEWGWDVAKLASVAVGLMSLLGLFFPDLLLHRFLHDPQTLELARLPLRALAATMSLDTVGMVFMNALLGAGDNLRVMAVAMVLQWVFFLPVAYLIGPLLGLGITGVWLAHIVYRVLQSAVFATIWRSGSWARIRV